MKGPTSLSLGGDGGGQVGCRQPPMGGAIRVDAGW